jgi:FkbM family methyltransferase
MLSKKIKLKNIKLFLRTIKKFGFTCTLKLCLRRLGLSRITPYHSFKFPFIDHKFKVVFRNNYWIEFEKGLQEINCVRFLQENVREGQIILDVGAWEGSFTLLCSNLVGLKGKVYAFDPDRIAFSNLQKNVRKNKIKNVYLENVGLSNSIGSATLHLIKGGGQTQSTLIFYKGGYHEKYTKCIQTISVPITTIDDYCEKNEIIPNGIKIDVEGAEANLIEGCQKVLSKYHPWILIEFHSGLMPEEKKIDNWEKITSHAKKVIFIDGNTNEYSYGNLIKNIPDCNYFHIYLQY